jgi:hypothetical protein
MAPSEAVSRLVSSKGYAYEILADRYIDIQFSSEVFKVNSLNALETMRLDMEYSRELVSKLANPSTIPFPVSPTASLMSNITKDSSSSSSAMTYLIRVRLAADRTSISDVDVKAWDIELPIDLSKYIRLQSGQAYASYVGSSLDLNEYIQFSRQAPNVEDALPEKAKEASRSSSCLGIDLTRIAFDSKGALSSYPAASTFTTTRYPETALCLESQIKRYRMFMNLKLNFKFPETFRVVMDSDSIACYSRIFSMLMKVSQHRSLSIAVDVQGMWLL